MAQSGQLEFDPQQLTMVLRALFEALEPFQSDNQHEVPRSVVLAALATIVARLCATATDAEFDFFNRTLLSIINSRTPLTADTSQLH